MEGEIIQILENWRSFIDLSRQICPASHANKETLIHLNICELITALRDTNRRQIKDETHRKWLRKVGNVAYETDDAVDELYKLMIPHPRPTETNGNYSNSNKSVCLPNNSVLRRKLSHKIKSIDKMIHARRMFLGIDEEKLELAFERSLLLPDITHSTLSETIREVVNASVNESTVSRTQLNRSSFSDIDEPLIVIGRDDDSRNILDMLLSSSVNLTPCKEPPAVVPILGFVGVGKTTLAQLVYNNELVIKHFQQRIWVCVLADDFNIFSILTKILEWITRKKWRQPQNLDALVCKVQEYLSGKRYLLVLDDVRHDNVEEWEKLKILLQIDDVHQQGSKILVTTRNNKVASMGGGSSPPYRLQRLSEEKCRYIINQNEFSRGEAMETLKMLEIRTDLARLCRGLPVIAIHLGRSLQNNNDEASWLQLRDGISSVYSEKILPGMMYKYDYLPLHLKKFFSYFSMFPRDQKMHRESLIRYWMAEGFIRLSDERNELSMEDLGKQYFNNLLGSQIFEDVDMDELDIENDESGCVKSIRLDELTHQLAREVAEDCAILKVSEMENHTCQVHRLRLVCDEDVNSISIPNNLRTLVGIQGLNSQKVAKVFSNKQLRVLELRNCMVGASPDLSTLIHLRYLDLSEYRDELLGQSISSLCHLQTLVLRGSGSLKELPQDIGSLKRLRYLDLSYTGITVLPDSSTSLQSLQELNLSNSQLQRLPPDFGGLEQLRHLDVSSTIIKTLPNTITRLSSLRTLKLDGCRYVELLPSLFGNLTHLICLDITGTRIKELHESVIGQLCNLETLKLGHCKLPQEVGHLKSLKHIIFEGDKFETPRGIQHLTGLQTLQQFVAREGKKSNGGGIGDLEELNLLKGKIKICKLENVRGKKDAERANLKGKRYLRCLELHWSSRSINSKYGSKDGTVLNALHPHPDLEILKITNFTGSKIPQWMGDSVSSHLPKLEELVLMECNQWKQLPALGQLPNLKVLSIHGMNSVKFLGNELYGGESSGSGKAPTRPFPSLVELTLSSMENLEDCPAPESGLPPFPILEKLTVSLCNKLKVLQTPFPSLKELKLQQCQSLEDLPYIKYLKSLKRFTVKDCMKLKLSPDDLKHVLATALLSIDRPVPAF